MFERNKTIQPSKSFVICSTKSQPPFDAKMMRNFSLFGGAAIVYISVFVLPINETKTDTYNEKSMLSSLKSFNFPETQRRAVTIGSQFCETVCPKAAPRLCSWRCEIYPMRNGAKLINRRYCEATVPGIEILCELWSLVNGCDNVRMHTLQILESVDRLIGMELANREHRIRLDFVRFLLFEILQEN